MQTGRQKPWYEREDLWEALRPVLFSTEQIESAGEQVEQVISLVDLQPGLSICDLGCGVGRHSLELARRGFRVTGVDRTELYLQEAKEAAAAEGLEIEFVKEDMRNFRRPDSFDVVLSLFTSFGYFEEASDNERVLANVYTSLKSNGKLLLEMMGKEVLARIFRPREWREEGGVTVLEEREVAEHWSRIENRWILLSDGQRSEYGFSHWLYSAAELCDMLKRCGFCGVEVYGNLSGSPYDHKAERLVVLARR
ncbi:MAG: class I SAM-dependent methyltransferase [Planctomycetota bacterium]|jgi:SAM-dependent methyltransferase